MQTDKINHAFLDGVLDGSREDVYYHFGMASPDPLLAKLRDVKAIIMAGSGGRIKEFAEHWSELNGGSEIVAFPKEDRFVTRYTAKFGEYNDESNTKVYALEYILATIAADPAAIDNVDAFKAKMDTFSAPNPYMKGDAVMQYVGTTSFGQKRQVSVPLVVNEFKDGAFQTMFVAQVD